MFDLSKYKPCGLYFGNNQCCQVMVAFNSLPESDISTARRTELKGNRLQTPTSPFTFNINCRIFKYLNLDFKSIISPYLLGIFRCFPPVFFPQLVTLIKQFKNLVAKMVLQNHVKWVLIYMYGLRLEFFMLVWQLVKSTNVNSNVSR